MLVVSGADAEWIASRVACIYAAIGRYHSAESAWAFFVNKAPLTGINPTPAVKDAFFASFEHEAEEQQKRQSRAEGGDA